MNNQPFLFLNESQQKNLLYCYSENLKELFFGNKFDINPWKIYIKNFEENEFILNTPTIIENYGKVILECNPHLFYKNNQLYLGYIAGISNGKNTPVIYYYLNSKTDLNLSSIYETTVIEKAFSAAYIKDNLFFTKKTPNGDVLIKNETFVHFNLNLNIKNIYRICPIFNNNNFFILTFSNETTDQSWLFHSDGQPIIEIKNSNNESVYKCSILNNRLIYTKKVGIEDRILIEEDLNPIIHSLIYS